MITKDVQRSRDRLERVKSSDRGSWKNQAINDRAFKANMMWSRADTKSMENKGQIAPTVNELVPTINQVVADLTRNTPRFYSTGVDNSDNKVSSEANILFSHIWDISKGNSKFRTFVTDYEDIGMGSLMAYVDPYADNGKGEIFIVDVDPLELYIDPNSKLRDSSDAAYILVVKLLDKEVIETHYPDFDFKGAQPSQDDDYPQSDRYAEKDQVLRVVDQEDSHKYELIDEYTKIKTKRYHVYDPTSSFEKTFESEEEYIEWSNELAVIITKLGQETYATESSQVEELMEVIRQYGTTFHLMQFDLESPPQIMSGVEHDNPYIIRGSTTKLEVVYKAQLLEQGIIRYSTPLVDRIKRVFSIGGKEVANYIIPKLTNYPIVTGMLHHNRNPFPMGDVRLVRNLQEELNKIDNLIITYHQNIANISFFVPRGSGQKKDIEARASQTGTKVFEYDPDLGGTPIMLQYMQMGSSFFAYRQSIIQQIQRIIGSYTFNDTQMTTPRTAEGTQIIDESMLDRTASKQRDIEDTINQLAKVVSELMQVVYTERKVVSLSVPNHEPKQVIFNDPQIRDDGSIEIFNDITQIKHDIRMVSGSSLPTNKAQQRAELMVAYQNKMLKNPRWWIEKSDFDNIDEVLKGEDLIGQYEGMLQQMQETIKDLEGQIQTKSREVIQVNEKIAVEKTKANLKGMESEIKHSVLHAKERMSDAVKNQKSQTKA